MPGYLTGCVSLQSAGTWINEVKKLVQEVDAGTGEKEASAGATAYSEETYDLALRQAIIKAENYLKPFLRMILMSFTQFTGIARQTEATIMIQQHWLPIRFMEIKIFQKMVGMPMGYRNIYRMEPMWWQSSRRMLMN